MGNMYQPVKDLMHRTMYNLKFIEDLKGPNGPYEVTQLINSFLGAMAHQWEEWRKELTEITLEQAQQEGWPVIVTDEESEDTPKSLGDLIRVMRNAIAHGNLAFVSLSQGGEIEMVDLWNRGGGKDTWRARVHVKDLRSFLDRFFELANKLYDREETELYDDVDDE
jgi:HEPN family protein